MQDDAAPSPPTDPQRESPADPPTLAHMWDPAMATLLLFTSARVPQAQTRTEDDPGATAIPEAPADEQGVPET